MSWILMVAAGLALMFAMRYTPPLVDFILVRMSAAAFVGAGVIGAAGWLGNLLQDVMGWLVSLINKIGIAALGTAVAWIIVAAVAALWVGALLPGKVFKYDFPDWLVFTGLVLPSLVGAVPGKAGGFLSAVITTSGETMNSAVAGIF